MSFEQSEAGVPYLPCRFVVPQAVKFHIMIDSAVVNIFILYSTSGSLEMET